MAETTSDIVTAALLIIGDEILSGRTKDKNIGYIADYLMQIGIDLREVRIVPDVEEEIVDAVNALRRRYTYVFTTGGIGPTHDDITADCVAKAFGVGISEHPRAIELLLTRIKLEDLKDDLRFRLNNAARGDGTGRLGVVGSVSETLGGATGTGGSPWHVTLGNTGASFGWRIAAPAPAARTGQTRPARGAAATTRSRG